MPHNQVNSWVCATIPMAGTVTYDCIPEVQIPPRMTLLRAFECLVPSMTKTMQTERKRQRRRQIQRQIPIRCPYSLHLDVPWPPPTTQIHSLSTLAVTLSVFTKIPNLNVKNCPPGSWQVSWMGHGVWQRRENVLKFLSLWGALHLCELLCTLSWCHKSGLERGPGTRSLLFILNGIIENHPHYFIFRFQVGFP